MRDGVFGLRPATEPPAWVAPYDYGKEAGRGERFNTTAEKAIALGSRWAIASFPKHRKLLRKGDRSLQENNWRRTSPKSHFPALQKVVPVPNSYSSTSFSMTQQLTIF
ncbi:hypothetical protein [Arthrospira platensis]|uniref:Uncharacterized protein n=2 Tax=Limnospira fusiformis TaxID=54297 RepID=A0ABU9EKN9_LIMFS|nr:seed calcium dependent protein kinase a [Arthrospira platensis C1]